MTNQESKFADNSFNLQNNLLANFSQSLSTPVQNQINTKSFFCQPCGLQLNSQFIYQQHLAGTKHKKKLNQIELIAQYNNQQTLFSNNDNNGNNNIAIPILNDKSLNTTELKIFRCDCCSINFTCQLNYDQHISGKSHRKKIESLKNQQVNNSLASESANCSSNQDPNNQIQKNNQNDYNCDICQLNMSGKEQLSAHLIGKKHLKKLASLNTLNVSKVYTNDNDTSKTSNDNSNTLIKNCNLSTIMTDFYNNSGLDQSTNSQSDDKELVQQQINQITKNVDTPYNSQFYCDICDINASSQEHLNIHFKGKKHTNKLNSISKIPIKIKQTKPKDDDSKFDHLNIAWSKYEIEPVKKIETNNLFDFYCSLCKKYIQRKLQLVDHLKSKKHHAKIIAARNSGKNIQNSKQPPIVNKPIFKPKNKKKFHINKQPLFNQPIQFVAASTNK